LKDIRNDLRKDSLKLEFALRVNDKKSGKLLNGLNVLEIGNYNFFNPDNFTLLSLLQSGDLKLIQSEDIKKEILRLQKVYEMIDTMQKNFLQALDDNYFPILLNKMDMVEFRAIDPDFFYGIEIKNYCAFTLNETNQQNQTYKQALKQIDKLMLLIEAEIDK
jgi:hypothetical protein